MNQRRRARGCAFVRAQNFTRILNEALARSAVAQKLNNNRFKRINVGNFDCAISGDKLTRKYSEVFHVRTKHDWLASQNRFDRILSTVRSKTFPHENNSGYVVPALKFTSCVEKHAICIVNFLATAQLAGEHDVQSQRIQVRADLPQAFDVSRRNEQAQ